MENKLQWNAIIAADINYWKTEMAHIIVVELSAFNF